MSFFSANSASLRAAFSRRESFPLRLVASGVVCLLFTSALVLAQVPEPPTPVIPPTPTAVKRQVEKIDVTTRVKKKADVPAAGAKAKGEPAKGALLKAAVKGKGVAKVAPGNREPLVQQFTTQGRPSVRAELIFVRKVCQLKTEELRKIKSDADLVLTEVVTKLVDAQLTPRARAIPRGQSTSTPDANKLLEDGLATVMKKNLSPEQWSRYQSEREKRTANRKQAAIRFLLDAIDRDLYLSDQQRTRLRELLSSHWDDGWALYLDYVLYGNQFYPQTIDPFVTPILSAAQKKVWQGAQKAGNFWGFGGVWGGFVNDNDALEEELGEVPQGRPQNGIQVRPQNAMNGQMMKAVILGGGRPAIDIRKVEMKKSDVMKAVERKAETKKAQGKNDVTEKSLVKEVPNP
jgi:hypothetical protein